MFEQDAALPLDDGFGQAGGTGGVEHPQGMIERHLFVDQVRSGRRHLLPQHGVCIALSAHVFEDIGNDDGFLQRW